MKRQHSGSSPRIRGEWRCFATTFANTGIIPANTGRIYMDAPGYPNSRDHPREYGENQSERPQPRTSRDHPREYGENIRCPARTWSPTGSSPRIRGELGLLMRLIMLPGIIPANTGRMPLARKTRYNLTDHPREYGENPVEYPADHPNTGSSPRIRGEFVGSDGACPGPGIIPANTGRMPLMSASENY